MERKNTNINIEISKIKDEYSKFFNESHRTNTEETLDKEKFNDYLRYYETTIFKHEIESKTIRAMIENLPLNKAIVLRGVSNEMPKYNNSEKLAEY